MFNVTLLAEYETLADFQSEKIEGLVQLSGVTIIALFWSLFIVAIYLFYKLLKLFI
jgi:hypothetical protein